jgi:MFS transporter, DHA1 family, multidrug resistance protein
VIGQGHIVGTASSLYGSITTLLGIGIGTVIGQDYDGTLLPIATRVEQTTDAAFASNRLKERQKSVKRESMCATVVSFHVSSRGSVWYGGTES